VQSGLTRDVSVRCVSLELRQQIRIDAEASGLTVRVWMLRALRRACGLPETGEIERGMGRPRRARQVEIEQEQARRERVEARRPAICGPARSAGELFICKLPPGHAGECSPTPQDPQSAGLK
jgi:hypothetical protein